MCRVSAAVGDEGILLARPAPNELPLCSACNVDALFAALPAAVVVDVVACLLVEARVALVSSRPETFSRVAAALLSLLFPFDWRGVVVPVCPEHLLVELVDAPVPFLIGGFDANYLASTEVGARIPPGVVFVDLDRGEARYPDEGFDDLELPPKLPAHYRAKLLKQLAQVDADRSAWVAGLAPKDSQMLKNVRRFGSPRSLDDPVEDWEGVIQRGGNGGPLAANDGFALERRACFSRFLVSTLAAYRDGEDKLVQSKDAASRPFFTKLLRTQLFSGFLSEAEAVAEDWAGDAHESPAVCAVRFFDESIRAKANRKTLTVTAKETPFLDATFAATETFIAPPPSREGLRNGAFPPRPDELPRDDLYPPRLRTPRTLVAKEREDEQIGRAHV